MFVTIHSLHLRDYNQSSADKCFLPMPMFFKFHCRYFCITEAVYILPHEAK